jgi:hypothetical protein
MDVKIGLARQIAGIDSVQKCVVNQQADIVIHSWRGIIIHVHLVAEPIKPRQIKRTLHEATRVGVGTLFIVDETRLPADGATITPADWLLALHALTDEKIYAYRGGENDQPRIRPAHFNSTNKADVREVWYGPDVPILRLPFYRAWVKTPSAIKGNWLVAHFGSEPFWRHPDYRNARYAAAQRSAARVGRGEHTAYEFGYGNGPAHLREEAPRHARLATCYQQLGLQPTADCDTVKAAFRRLVHEVHPDVSNLPKDQAETRFRAINEAYVYIREQVDCS